MAKKYTFPEPGCSICSYYKTTGNFETRYCSGFKHRKPRRFRNSDPLIKAPKWCPRRITPPICHIYGFVDERAEYMELLRRMEYDAGMLKIISPLPSHYVPRAEIPVGLTAKAFYDATQTGYLCDILTEPVHNGEIVEIDNGLKPYCFYVLNSTLVLPLPYFHFNV